MQGWPLQQQHSLQHAEEILAGRAGLPTDDEHPVQRLMQDWVVCPSCQEELKVGALQQQDALSKLRLGKMPSTDHSSLLR